MTIDSRGSVGRSSYSASAYYERLIVTDGEPALNDAMSTLLAHNWWAIALRGAVAIAFGIIALLLPSVTMLALVLLFAAYMLVDGVLAIIASRRRAGRTGGDGSFSRVWRTLSLVRLPSFGRSLRSSPLSFCWEHGRLSLGRCCS
jgi:hypothetical protein